MYVEIQKKKKECERMNLNCPGHSLIIGLYEYGENMEELDL